MNLGPSGLHPLPLGALSTPRGTETRAPSCTVQTLSGTLAGGTMKQAGRAALLMALLLLAALRPGSSQWRPGAAAARVQDPSLRWSPGVRNQGGGARALLLLLAERFPHRAGLDRWGARTAGERPRRDDPPLSIDLTFHLLRTLLELARTQSQRERAEQNRIIFDSVGK
ncbi:Urocortin [Manis pentadactyla]|nr:Urocortin [Manis pentadactyla]